MGTRGLLGLVISGKRHAAYCHNDSYPSQLGRKIAEFIIVLTPEEWDEMARLVQNITWVDDEDEPSKELQDLYSGLEYPVDHELHATLRQLSLIPPILEPGAIYDWHKLLRGIQGAPALMAIKSGNLKHLVEYIDFQGELIFCEWSYFIDFEKRTLESWDRELLDEIAFDDLKKEGAKEYMERVQKIHDKEEEADFNADADEEEVAFSNGDVKAREKE